MKFLRGLCQDDVTTSSGDVVSRNKLHIHLRENFLGKVTKGILEICYGSGVMQQKSRLGVNLPPLDSMRVNVVYMIVRNVEISCVGSNEHNKFKMTSAQSQLTGVLDTQFSPLVAP